MLEITHLKTEIEEQSALINEHKMEIASLTNKLDSLNAETEELYHDLKSLSLTEKTLMQTIDIAVKFTVAFIKKDVDTLTIYAADNLVINHKEISNAETNTGVPYLKNNNLDYRLNSYALENKQMFYQFMILDTTTDNVSGFFVNLCLKLTDDAWRVSNIELDI